MNITKGKNRSAYVAQTFCDFGDPKRKDVMSNHFGIESGLRQCKRIARIYHGIHGWNVWMEDLQGNVLLSIPEPTKVS